MTERDEDRLLCGVNAVLEMVRRDPARIRRVLVSPTSSASRVLAELRKAGIQAATVDQATLDRRARGIRHQGVVAEVDEDVSVEIEDLLGPGPACLVALDEVTDPRNLGAVVRSAEAFGARGVVVPRHRAASMTALSARAAAGATAMLPVATVTNLTRGLEIAQKASFWTVGFEASARDRLGAFELPERAILVLGSEGKGLRPVVRAACDHRVAIPMTGRVASLNVSVAAAVALWEWARRWAPRRLVDTP